MQLLQRIAEDFLIGKTIEDAFAFHVYDGDHVRGILRDEAEELLTSNELAPHAVNLELLIEGVDVKNQDQADKPAHSLRKVRKGIVVAQQEGRQPKGKQQGDNNRSGPKKPFAPFDAADTRSNCLGWHAGRISTRGLVPQRGMEVSARGEAKTYPIAADDFVDGGVLRACADQLPSVFINRKEGVHYFRTEQFSTFAENYASCCVRGESRTVRAIRGHGIEAVCNSENPRADGNIFAAQAARLAAAIVALVVGKDHFRGSREERYSSY